MIKVEISGDSFEKEAQELEAMGMSTYMALQRDLKKIFGDIYAMLPMLMGNLKRALQLVSVPGRKEAGIELRNKAGSYYSPLGYGTKQYFDKWPEDHDMHRSKKAHTKSEVSRTKRLGRSVMANPRAESHAFEKVLRKHGFTNIKVLGDGTIDADPPPNWPNIET